MMSEWWEILQVFIQIAFAEGSKAVFWMLGFGVLGLLVGLFLTLVAWKLLKRRVSEPENLWSKRGRVAFAVILGVCVIPLMVFNGGLFGLVWSAEKSIQSGDFIEDGLVTSLGEVPGYEEAVQFLIKTQARVSATEADTEKERLHIPSLRKSLQTGEAELLTSVTLRFLGENTESKLPGWLSWTMQKVTDRLVETELSELMSRAETVLDDTEERAGSSYVSPEELTWSVGHVFIKPEILKLARSFRNSVLIGAVLQIGGVLLIFTLIGAVLWVVLPKMNTR